MIGSTMARDFVPCPRTSNIEGLGVLAHDKSADSQGIAGKNHADIKNLDKVMNVRKSSRSKIGSQSDSIGGITSNKIVIPDTGESSPNAKDAKEKEERQLEKEKERKEREERRKERA